MSPLVQREQPVNRVQPEKGIEILQNSQYSSRIPVYFDESNWRRYTMDFLQVLRNADKSNWHHRVIAKVCFREFLILD